jgi:hypothetical protein
MVQHFFGTFRFSWTVSVALALVSLTLAGGRGAAEDKDRPGNPPAKGPLVTRNQVKLNLAGAELMFARVGLHAIPPAVHSRSHALRAGREEL